MNILQLTDIHYGGEYGGKFECEKNFVSTLEANIPGDYDLIVLTGDLADKDHECNYARIKDTLDRTGIMYMVLPGNHDDAVAMRKVFGESTVPDCGWIVRWGMLFWDNTDTFSDSVPNGPFSTVFCHYPVGFIKHAFMEHHAHPFSEELAVRLQENGVADVFCGHFHYPSTCHSGDLTVHVCRGTQCQLDPNGPECSPIESTAPDGRPGCVRIVVDDCGSLVETEEFVLSI